MFFTTCGKNRTLIFAFVIDHYALNLIWANCPKLRVVEITLMTNFIDVDRCMGKLARACPKLEHLKLQGRITDSGLAELAFKCHHLHRCISYLQESLQKDWNYLVVSAGSFQNFIFGTVL